MFSSEQRDFAIATLEELRLRQRVPERLNDDEAWSSFVYELFSTAGWRQFSLHYQGERLMARQRLHSDLEQLQQSRAGGGNALLGSPQSAPPSLEWLHELVQEQFHGGALDENEFESMDTSHAADLLAFELGQRIVSARSPPEH